MKIVCYFLQCWNPQTYNNIKTRKSYIGYTVNLKRRLRQHRKEIKGGAKYTSSWKHVELVGYISGFDTKKQAQSFEWHAKRRNRKQMDTYKQHKIICDNLNIHSRFAEFISTKDIPKFQDIKPFLQTHFHTGIMSDINPKILQII
jgi:predicted GIY-YIG superfamily endonuclease